MSPKPTNESSLAKVIGFFLGFRIILLVLGVRVFGLDPPICIGVTLALTVLLFAIAALGKTSNVGAKYVWHLTPVRWATLFLAFAGISLTWTVAVSTAAAAAFWVAMVADAGMIYFLLHQGDPMAQTLSIARGYVTGACWVAAICWVLPSQTDLRLGDEELLGPNQVGFLFAFALFFAIFLIRQSAGSHKLSALFLAATLLRSLSKTSIIAVAIALLWLLFRDRTLERKKKFVALAVSLAVVILFSSLLVSYIQVYLNLGNQSVTLSGRVTIWAYVLNEAVEMPWFGHGFHSMWKVIPPLNGDFEARHAHNELLQQFYAYGVSGVVLLIGIYGSFWLQIRRMKDHPMAAFLSALLVFTLIRGLTDTEVFDLTLPMWSIILWSIVMKHATQPLTFRPVTVSFPLSPNSSIVTT